MDGDSKRKILAMIRDFDVLPNTKVMSSGETASEFSFQYMKSRAESMLKRKPGKKRKINGKDSNVKNKKQK